MFKRIYISLFSVGAILVAGCTSEQVLFEQTLDPVAPSTGALAAEAPRISENLSLASPLRRVERALPSILSTSPRKATSASDYTTIMGQEGSVITVWALAPRNWLWGYTAINSTNFGNIRNWKIERSFRREHFRFINQQLNTCIQAYGNGLIHATCEPKNLDQDFELIPTTSGAIFIKSVSQQRCVTYNPVNTQGYLTITLSKCDDNITPLRDQTWYLTPPFLPANPIIGE